MMKNNFVHGLFVGATENTTIQFFRYLFVGGAAFVADFGFLYIFTHYFGINYLVSATLSFVIGLAINYLLSVRWVFNQHKTQSRYTEFLIFLGIGIIGLLFNDLIMWLSTSVIGLFYLVSKIISTAIVYFWNFFARKYILFSSAKHA